MVNSRSACITHRDTCTHKSTQCRARPPTCTVTFIIHVQASIARHTYMTSSQEIVYSKCVHISIGILNVSSNVRRHVQNLSIVCTNEIMSLACLLLNQLCLCANERESPFQTNKQKSVGLVARSTNPFLSPTTTKQKKGVLATLRTASVTLLMVVTTAQCLHPSLPFSSILPVPSAASGGPEVAPSLIELRKPDHSASANRILLAGNVLIVAPEKRIPVAPAPASAVNCNPRATCSRSGLTFGGEFKGTCEFNDAVRG